MGPRMKDIVVADSGAGSREHHELAEDFEMHFVELSKIESEPESSALKLWMRFLSAHNEKELEELAMSDSQAKGRMGSLQLAVEAACEVLGIEIDFERREAFTSHPVRLFGVALAFEARLVSPCSTEFQCQHRSTHGPGGCAYR